MTHPLNETVKLEGDNYTIIAIIHDDGNTDAGISIHVGKSARDGHCELIATDNACDWLFGDRDDHVNNRDHFAALNYRIDIDAIRAIDGDLADYVAKRQAEADLYDNEQLGDIINDINDTNNCYVCGRPAELAASIEFEDIEVGGVKVKGTICISVIADVAIDGLVADVIDSCIVGLPLEWVASDEAAPVAWYKVVEG